MTIVISCVVYFAGIIIVNILYFEKIKILKDRLKTSENHIDWLDHSNKLLHLKLKMYKERYYTKLVELGIYPSISKIRRNKPELMINLDKIDFMDGIKIKKKRWLWILIGE